MGTEITIDLERNVLTIDKETFSFTLSDLEKKLTKLGGMTNAFNQFGKRIYDVLTGRGSTNTTVVKDLRSEVAKDVMAW